MFCGLKREAGKVRQRKRLELAMEYQNVYTARFVERPNRFIACVAEYGLLLRESEYRGTANFPDLTARLDELSEYLARDEFKAEFAGLVGKAGTIYACQ